MFAIPVLSNEARGKEGMAGGGKEYLESISHLAWWSMKLSPVTFSATKRGALGSAGSSLRGGSTVNDDTLSFPGFRATTQSRRNRICQRTLTVVERYDE